MTTEEKKQIYLDRFPTIIGRRMSEQFQDDEFSILGYSLTNLISFFNCWSETQEGPEFWYDIHRLYYNNETIEHQQILDIFHKHGIKP